MELDVSENKLKMFPYIPLRRLRLISSLNLAWNEISDLSELTLAAAASEYIETANSISGSVGGYLSPASVIGPAAHLEWPMLRYLNLNSNYLRKLKKDTFRSMGALRTLSIHLNSIERVDEDAFSSLTMLESIDLSHNKITMLPSGTFRQNTRLVSIDLSNNHVHLIGHGLFNNLTELRELYLNGNNVLQLTSHTFFGSPRLSVIYLQGNALKFIDSSALSPLKNLSQIRLSDNFLTVLPQDLFLKNENLVSISLDGNSITQVVPGLFYSCRKGLRELRLQNNAISSIQLGVLDGLHVLEEVHLENNMLAQIRGLNTLKMLRHVSLSRNNLIRLTHEMIPSTELPSLSLGHNSIRSVEDGTFANQSSLSILFLGNNELTRLTRKMFTGLRSLTRLYLQHNNISWIHGDCFRTQTKAVQYIDLSYNSLKIIYRTVFSALAFIEEINLSHNLISSIEEASFVNLRSLRILDLSHNYLVSVDYGSVFQFSGLHILKLGSNRLLDFNIEHRTPAVTGIGPANGNILLTELDLSENQLRAQTLQGMEMPRLEVLQLSGNNLTDLDENCFAGFPALAFLSAQNAHITSLPPTVFQKNEPLTVVRLSENFLTYLPDAIFGSRLRELHLRHNRLLSFPYKALSNASNLEILTLSGNRINSLYMNRLAFLKLKQFDMNDNNLTELVGWSLTQSMPLLQVVDFGENNLSHISDELVQNMSLNQINFGGNGLRKIPFAFSDQFVSSSFVLNMSGNPLISFYTENHPQRNISVMDLYLSDTPVTYLMDGEFKIYPKLRRLVIKRSPMRSIPPKTFSILDHLNLLDLSENDIDDVQLDSFMGLVQLKSLNLSHNRIKSLTSFHPHLAGLQVRSNISLSSSCVYVFSILN